MLPENVHLPDLPRFHDDQAALAYMERIRWPEGPVCPRCNRGDRVSDKRSPSKPERLLCNGCTRRFTVRLGTVIEGSHLPYHQILRCVYLVCYHNASAVDLAVITGTNRKAAGRLRKKILAAMNEVQ